MHNSAITRAVHRLLGSARGLTAVASKPACAASTWSSLQSEAHQAINTSTRFGFGQLSLIKNKVLNHESLAEGLSATLGAKLNAGEHGAPLIDYQQMIIEAYKAKPELADAAAADLARFLVLDPAADGYLRIFLFFKGFHCVQCARVANHFWTVPDGRYIHVGASYLPCLCTCNEYVPAMNM